MNDFVSEKEKVGRRDFLKFAGVLSAWIVMGARTAALEAKALAERFLARIQAAYGRDAAMTLRKPQDNPQVQSLYAEFLGEPLGERSESLLHTGYVDRSAAVAAVAARPARVRPETLSIASVYPNPFNASAEIEFETSGSGMVWLAVFDAAGRRVRSLVETRMPAGLHTVRWDGRDASGRPAPSGVYIARIVSGSRAASRRMTLAK
jgi:hypothetical protein